MPSFRPVLRNLLIIVGLTSSIEATSAPIEKDFKALVSERGSREVIWSFDAAVTKPNYQNPDGSMIEGYGGNFTIGYGRFLQDYWLLARMHFLAGPFDLARHGQFDADYNGTILDVEYGMAFPGYSLRPSSGGIISMSAGYMDLNGHNIGENRKNDGDQTNRDNYYLEQGFRTSTGALIITPSIGWIWAEAPRPRGNEPELLATRVESSYIKLSTQIPLYSHSRVEVIKRDDGDSLSQTPTKRTSTGRLKGYAIILSTGVWLGI